MTTILNKRLSKDDVLAMTAEERLNLMQMLWDSLSPDELEIVSGHAAEIERRLESYEADKASGVQWEIVREEIRRSLK